MDTIDTLDQAALALVSCYVDPYFSAAADFEASVGDPEQLERTLIGKSHGMALPLFGIGEGATLYVPGKDVWIVASSETAVTPRIGAVGMANKRIDGRFRSAMLVIENLEWSASSPKLVTHTIDGTHFEDTVRLAAMCRDTDLRNRDFVEGYAERYWKIRIGDVLELQNGQTFILESIRPRVLGGEPAIDLVGIENAPETLPHREAVSLFFPGVKRIN